MLQLPIGYFRFYGIFLNLFTDLLGLNQKRSDGLSSITGNKRPRGITYDLDLEPFLLPSHIWDVSYQIFTLYSFPVRKNAAN